MKTLITERLILREWSESDVNDLYEYAKSELVGPSAGWQPHKNEEESKEVLNMFMEGKEVYAIVLKSENKVIGSIGLHNRKPDDDFSHLNQREIGYGLNHEYWGKGIMPEAVRRAIQYGFDELNLDLIWCAHYDFNNNSKRVIEKCGFKYKFQKKQRLELLGNKEVTTLYYSIFKGEYSN